MTNSQVCLWFAAIYFGQLKACVKKDLFSSHLISLSFSQIYFLFHFFNKRGALLRAQILDIDLETMGWLSRQGSQVWNSPFMKYMYLNLCLMSLRLLLVMTKNIKNDTFYAFILHDNRRTGSLYSSYFIEIFIELIKIISFWI